MSNKDIIGSKENLNFWKIDQKNKKDKNTGFDSKDTQAVWGRILKVQLLTFICKINIDSCIRQLHGFEIKGEKNLSNGSFKILLYL